MILMYHHVAPIEAVPAVKEPNEGWELTISPQGFDRQLTELRCRGYRFVSLAEIVNDIRKRGVEDRKTVAVTFDDGWVDNYQFAFPVLKRLLIKATFFVTSAHLRNGTHDEKRMSLAQLKVLLDEGMTIGGHSRTHPDLTKMAPKQAREEISGCKADLENALGVEVQFFAYPGGIFNREVARLTEEAGYTAACSVLSPASNTTDSMFWLFRDVLSESMITMPDRYRLSRFARQVLSFRVKRRLKSRLDDRPVYS